MFLNKYLNKTHIRNDKFLSQYFEIFNNFMFSSKNKHKNKHKKKKKEKNKHLLLWESFLYNKKSIIFFIGLIVNSLYRIKHNIKNWQTIKFKNLIIISNIVRFLLVKEKHYNYFNAISKQVKLNKLDNNSIYKKKKSSFSLNKNKSYLINRKRKHFFFLSKQYNINMFFFRLFKNFISDVVINNTFVVYNNYVLFHNIKRKYVFYKDKVMQFDFLIKDFLNQEIEVLFK